MSELSDVMKSIPDGVAEQIRPIARLTNHVHFIQEFRKQCRVSSTNVEAYQKTEQIYCWLFGVNKYSSYDSFRQVMYRETAKMISRN